MNRWALPLIVISLAAGAAITYHLATHGYIAIGSKTAGQTSSEAAKGGSGGAPSAAGREGDVPPRLSAEGLFATLDVDAPLPTEIKGSRGEAIFRPTKGWLHINDSLVGALPLHRPVRLIGGDYRVRTVLYGGKSFGVNLLVVTTDVTIADGATKALDVSREIDSTLAASSYYTDSKPFWGPHYVGTGWVDFAQQVPGPGNWREFISYEARRLSDFEASPDWLAIAAAAERVGRAGARPTVYVEWSYTLGGPREVDPAELRAIAGLATREFTHPSRHCIFEVRDAQAFESAGLASDRPVAVAAMAQAQRAFQTQRAAIDGIVERLAAAMEAAPKE